MGGAGLFVLFCFFNPSLSSMGLCLRKRKTRSGWCEGGQRWSAVMSSVEIYLPSRYSCQRWQRDSQQREANLKV